MGKLYPRHKAYRQCGFHNRTLAELRKDASLCRGAVLGNEPGVAHVPNVFGSFTHAGITYHTVLNLIGVKNPYEDGVLKDSSRGVSVLRFEDIGANKKLWNFNILIDRKFCNEEEYEKLRPGDEDGYNAFCFGLTSRTEIFAMEFMCCYRFYLETVLEVYKAGNCAVVRVPVREGEMHPKLEEVHDLLCSFEDIARHLEWFVKKHDRLELDCRKLNEYLGLHLERNRRTFLPYYRKWLNEHRVAPQIVESRTMEFIAMGFLAGSHEN